MPNFNGAIIVHTLQLIKTPATIREIVTTIGKNLDLSQDELMKPVKQTLDMGHRLGFLQKLNGRYFLVPMTFDTLMAEMQAPGLSAPPQEEVLEKNEQKQKPEKKSIKNKTQKCEMKKILLLNHFPTVLDHDSTTTLMPTQSTSSKTGGLVQAKPKRSQLTK